MLIKDLCVMSRPGSTSLSYLQQIIVKPDYCRYREEITSFVFFFLNEAEFHVVLEITDS